MEIRDDNSALERLPEGREEGVGHGW